MNPYEQFVTERMAAGDDPNDITCAFNAALRAIATDWSLWGDDEWRLDTVCAVCGSALPGLCGHSGMYEGGHILRREYVPGKYGDPDIVRCRDCGRTGHKDVLQLAGLSTCADCRKVEMGGGPHPWEVNE